MGLFNLFNRKNQPKQSINKQDFQSFNQVDFTEALLSTLSLGGAPISKQYETAVSKELKACDINNTGFPDRQTLLNKIISLIDGTETPQKRYILARAYSWSHAEYRQKAIEYLKLYLSNEIYDKVYANIYRSTDKNNPASWVSPRDSHLWNQYIELGDACLGEYQFEDAVDAYLKAIEHAPSLSAGYAKLAKAYVHSNRLDLALKVFEDAKKTPYYNYRTWYNKNTKGNEEFDFYASIDNWEQDIKKKIESGYVYKPRQRKKKQ